MSVERFQIVLKLASLGNDDKVWFGRWLRRYAVFLRQPENLPLLVSQQLVKQFCRTLLAREVPAWQRLQAVRAIGFYRNEVLATAEPDLLEIRQIPAIAAGLKAETVSEGRKGVRNRIGNIHANGS